MAFEDRSSPTAGSGPGDDDVLARRSSDSYTCTTVSRPAVAIADEQTLERTYFKMTAYALSGREVRNTGDGEESPDGDDSKDAPHHITYSIRNILAPDFGLRALQRVRRNENRVLVAFRPYEDRVNNAVVETSVERESPITTENRRPSTPVIASKKSSNSAVASSDSKSQEENEKSKDNKLPTLWPAWVYCTRYSDRPSSGPRSRRMKKTNKAEEKRPRTAFSGAQLARLKHEFAENRYLTEKRRQQLSQELGLNEAQIKIWFQNKRAKIKKSSGQKNALAIQLMAQGLYNHSTAACDEDDMPISP